MKYCNVVHVRTQRQPINLSRRNSIFDLKSSLIEQKHGWCRNYQEYWRWLEREFMLTLIFKINSNYYLCIWSCDFVNYVCKNYILVISLDAHSFPLHIMSHSNIISNKRMSNTGEYTEIQNTLCTNSTNSPHRIRSFPVFENNTSCYLLPHPVSWCLIERSPINITSPSMVDSP